MMRRSKVSLLVLGLVAAIFLFISSEVAATTAQGGTSTSSVLDWQKQFLWPQRRGSMINISMDTKMRLPFLNLLLFDHDRRDLFAEPAVTEGAAAIAGCPAADAVMARIWHRK
ncbi:hypothetical protein SAY87_011638 [Trapa incisa]|uniref:Uncharacterized protein n=1 Tax=Trapa incisa TaxID=236973 RepID=A0AAN7JBL6_9MYRT|nr:hypothetical protein SAY87_011638 [Trapa incisa]